MLQVVSQDFRTSGDGLVTLGPRFVAMMRKLDDRIRGWAAEIGAEERQYPPLVRVADLDKLDYFVSFPHLGLAVSPIALDARAHVHEQTSDGAIPPTCLCDSHLMLPSAACYPVYLGLGGTDLDAPKHITTLARCFRNEDYFDGLRRLLGFTMREIVCVGGADDVKHFLQGFRARVVEFAESLGLKLAIETATDPFFKKDSAKAIMQTLFPVKEEFVFDGDLAIASVNFHRNFFGERCDISYDGKPAFTGCVAFGLERWLHALSTVHGETFDDLLDRI